MLILEGENTHIIRHMASGIFTTVKLEPFFQQFLRVQFEQADGEVFKFPKGHNLNSRLNLVLTREPFNFNGHHYGEYEFKVGLYYASDFDIRQKNYVSPRQARSFAGYVRDFHNMLFHEFYARRFKLLGHKETVYLWMETYDFDESSYERLEREARRYRRKNINRKYYERTKLINVKSSPVQEAVCPV
ncbi:hypothetical protein [Carboxylicivirga marina]|uniref:hypothetical protein n=1 Tax=Carboxylicivirga marina TaxID=2800988 RepID=UPI0025983FF1|nr:hypothetical protein [uncultured Carboxylicivirga sp.]